MAGSWRPAGVRPPSPWVTLSLLVAFALLILGALALRGRMLGLALYAVAPVLLITAGDGSNDTSLGLLLLIGLVLLARKPMLGAFIVGLAVAFKPTAAAWLPPVVGWAGAAGLLSAAAGAGLFWLPAVVMWGLQPVLASIGGAATLHETAYYSLAYAIERFGVELPKGFYALLAMASGALLATISIFRVRSADGVIGWGALVFLITLFGGFWSTFAYFAAVAPIVCWRLDGWLGHGDSRVRWPRDPVGRLEAWLDDRWPAVESGTQRRFQ